MAQGKTKINGPHQGAWVHTSQGEDWFLHFNDKYAYGRVIFLQPVNWKTGWPVMGQDKDGDGCGEPYLTYRMPKSTSHTKVNPQESDEFNSTELGLQWQWHANYNQLWGMPTNNGCMRLYTADLTTTDKRAIHSHSRAFGKQAISCCRRPQPRTLQPQQKSVLHQKKMISMAALS